MKKLLYTLLAVSVIFSACEEEDATPINNNNNSSNNTYVPDTQFEQELINLGLDDILDDYVTTSSIDTVTELYLNDNGSIAYLTGIEDFASLNWLECRNNNITSLDLSQNSNLTWLHCSNNDLTNINLGSIDIEIIYCFQNNLINLNLSNNSELIEIYTDENNLENLNLKNGNSTNIFTIATGGNPNLTCIEVDDPNTMNPFVFASQDPQHFLSTNCP